MEHGKASTYVNWGCRCDRCRKANSEDVARRRKRRAKKTKVPRAVHGSVNGYSNYGCRCKKCKKAHADAERTRRKAKK